MNFGTKGCMYNCGDECTGECIKVETKTKKMNKEDIIVEIERLVELYNEKPNYGTIDLDMFNEHFNTLIKKIKQDE